MAKKQKQSNEQNSHPSAFSRRIRRKLPKSSYDKKQTASGLKNMFSSNEKEKSKKASFKFPNPFATIKEKMQNKQQTPKRKRRLLKFILLTFLALIVFVCTATAIFASASTKNDNLWLNLEQIPYKTETILYYTDAETGTQEIYTTLPCTQNKEFVEGAQMPKHLKNAFVAVEDQNFYKHKGVSIKRTVFAALNEIKNIITGSYIGGDAGRKQGASTINQQLVKNLTLDADNSNMAGYLRKIREIWRAVKLDIKYDKDVILEAYLNTISFTGNTAGVGAEAMKLFGVETQELSLAQAASLAAITRNPTRYSPVKNPEFHLERRNYVLNEMQKQNYISKEECEAAKAQPIGVLDDVTEPIRENVVTSYFTDAIIDTVISKLSSTYNISRKEATNLFYNGGLRINTTLVPQVQTSMEQVMENASVYPRPSVSINGPLVDDDEQPILDENDKQAFGKINVKPQGAMVTLGYNGDVCALVGGLGEKKISRGFNRATQAIRQVGSTMKPIGPYAVALEKNIINWSSPFMDTPFGKETDERTGEEIDWPKNVDNRYSEKEILVREAMARSVNTIAVRVGNKVGARSIYNFVKSDLKIPSIVKEDAKLGPMVLGSSTTGISPAHMAKAFAMFGNGGYTPEIHFYTNITNGEGDVLLQSKQSMHQSISEDTSYIMNRLLREVVTGNGTASGMGVPGEMDSVGKTGTTSYYNDHWFVGLTPYYVTASWYGYDENIQLRADSRSSPPTLAWRKVMQQAQQNLPYKEFIESRNVVEVNFCTTSGFAASASCPSASGYYKADHLPPNGCPVHNN